MQLGALLAISNTNLDSLAKPPWPLWRIDFFRAWPWPGGRGRVAVAGRPRGWPWPGGRVAVAGWPWPGGRGCGRGDGADGRVAGWPGGRMAGWPGGRMAAWMGGQVGGWAGVAGWPWPWPDGRLAGICGWVAVGGGAFLEDDCNLLTAGFKQYQAAFCCPVCGARLLEQIYHICLNQKHRFVC